MEIQVKVEIFDDPVFCENNFEFCQFYDSSFEQNGDPIIRCNLFDFSRKETGKRFKKCPKCKKAYQKEKNK